MIYFKNRRHSRTKCEVATPKNSWTCESCASVLDSRTSNVGLHVPVFSDHKSVIPRRTTRNSCRPTPANKPIRWRSIGSFRRVNIYSTMVTFFLLCLLAEASRSTERIYTNQFAVHIPGGQSVATNVADRYGFNNIGQVGNLKDYYLFEHHTIKKRSLDYSHHHHQILKNDANVLWVEQQHSKKRVKRDGVLDGGKVSGYYSNLPDPLYAEQWYLHKGAYGGHDMNIIPVWEQGYTGKGVVVTILDDGIQSNHPDLVQNYDALASIDINDHDDDPMPQDNGDNKHGTRCAGEVAATAFNEFCGVGIAYNSSIGGVRMLDGTVTDEVEARALSLNPNHIDIYSASWGPEDDGKTVDGPGRLAKHAFQEGINKGRRGLGSIFVWASGNGGRHQDNCNCDGYTNSIYTLSISSATQAGAKPWYLEECSSTLATTYSSGTPHRDSNVVTVDMDLTYFRELQKHHTPNPSTLCTRAHTGTSASAPIAAAICALTLEANPRLTWRDMQHLVVITSRPEPLNREDGWVTNGVGRKVNHKFGYGLMDATAMVKFAEQWTTVPPQRSCHTPSDRQQRIIPNQYGEKLEVSMATDGCAGTPNMIQYLEHVQVQITLDYVPRGNLHIILISPSGTPSSVLLPRPFDNVDSTFNSWPFLSVHFWGESPKGQWKLVIADEGRRRSTQPGTLREWSLVFYGTERNPVNLKTQTSHVSRHFGSVVRDTSGLPDNPCIAEGKYQMLEHLGECKDQCPDGFFSDGQHMCQICNPNCATCYGASSDNCRSCNDGKYLGNDRCMEECDAGYFPDISTGECLPCSSKCSTCRDSSDTCIHCHRGLFHYQNKCVASCPEHTYQTQDARCNSCESTCKSCKGPREDDCLTCPQSSYSVDGRCVPTCPDGFYGDFIDRRCLRCKGGCKACEVKDQCLECKEDWQLSGSLCTLKKENCHEGYYYTVDAEDCLPCNKSCKDCKDLKTCTACVSGRFLHEGQCLSTCPSGYYGINSERVCTSCQRACKSCSGSGECLSCHEGLYLHQSACISSCPAGYYGESGGVCSQCHSSCKTCAGPTYKNCTTCQIGVFYMDGTCHTDACPGGYYNQNDECMLCHHLCRTCNGAGPRACTSCHRNAVLMRDGCYSCLPIEYFDQQEQKCRPCHTSCSQCNGPSEHHCQACLAPLYLDIPRNSCIPCCNGRQNPKVNNCCFCSPASGACNNMPEKTRSVVSWERTHTPVGEDQLVVVMSDVVPIIVGICASTVILFFVIFGVLQFSSYGRCRRPTYKRLPVAKYENNSEKILLTHGEEEEDDEEEELFEKT